MYRDRRVVSQALQTLRQPRAMLIVTRFTQSRLLIICSAMLFTVYFLTGCLRVFRSYTGYEEIIGGIEHEKNGSLSNLISREKALGTDNGFVLC